MKREIDCAVNYLVGLVETNSDISQYFRKSIFELIRRRFGSILTKKYEGHWFPGEPCKDQEYRSIRVSSPEFQHAVMTCGRMLESLRLPPELTIWVDPGEVRYRLTGRSPISCVVSFKDDEETSYDVQDTSFSSLTQKSVDFDNASIHHLSETILRKWEKANSLLQSFCKHLIRSHDHVQTILSDENIVFKFYTLKCKYDPELIECFNSNDLRQLLKKILLLKNLVSVAKKEMEKLFEMIKDYLSEIYAEIDVTYSGNFDTIITGSERTFTVNELQQEFFTFVEIFSRSHWARIMRYTDSPLDCQTTRPGLVGWCPLKIYAKIPEYWGDGPALLASTGVLDTFFQRRNSKLPQDMH